MDLSDFSELERAQAVNDVVFDRYRGRPAREVHRVLSGALEEAGVEVSITSLMKLSEAIADDRRVDVGPYIG